MQLDDVVHSLTTGSRVKEAMQRSVSISINIFKSVMSSIIINIS